MDKISEPMRHGMLILHGAGMPANDPAKEGDTLSTISNGLIEFFTQNSYLSRHFEMTTSAGVKGPELSDLYLRIYHKEKERRGKLAFEIHAREVFWKPRMPQVGLLDYIPLLWLGAFAFGSQIARQRVSQSQAKHKDSESGTNRVEDDSKNQRERADLVTRTSVAFFGLLSLLFWGLIDSILHQWSNSVPLLALNSTPAIVIIALSLMAAVLLVLFAFVEYSYRRATPSQPLPKLYLAAMMLSTAWLALFLLPVVLAIYYLEYTGSLLALAALVVLGIPTVQSLPDWGTRIGALAVLALAAFALVYATQDPTLTKLFSPLVGWIRQDMRRRSTVWLTRLIVIAGAPLLIIFIYLLQFVGFLPLIGEPFNKLAQAISTAGSWEALKDIHMYFTDPSRSAQVRLLVERQMRHLDDTDHIHVLSHSLGTVVAYDTLVTLGRGDGVRIHKQDDPVYTKISTLVTFGSPLNKVRKLAQFGELMPDLLSGFDFRRFGTEATLPRTFCQSPAGSGEPLHENPDDLVWLNYYAMQDVVSDVCSLYDTPNDPVPPHNFACFSAQDVATAHGSYWSDTGFWNTCLQTMNIVYEKGELYPIEKLHDREPAPGLIDALVAVGITTREQVLRVLATPSDRHEMAKSLGGQFTEEQLRTFWHSCSSARR